MVFISRNIFCWHQHFSQIIMWFLRCLVLILGKMYDNLYCYERRGTIWFICLSFYQLMLLHNVDFLEIPRNWFRCRKKKERNRIRSFQNMKIEINILDKSNLFSSWNMLIMIIQFCVHCYGILLMLITWSKQEIWVHTIVCKISENIHHII